MKKILISGIQPTGEMHLGNLLGAVANWVKLQEDYQCYYFIADLHSLTTIYEHPEKLRRDKFELALNLLASGIDPDKSCLFFQSDILQHSELHLILSMICPLPWLLRVPSYKGKMEEIKDKDLDTYGFLGYPVLMAADILLYKAEVVPVGKDQVPHLELTREIARRFNSLYQNFFPLPQEKLTEIPVLPGLDGRKMSKSYQNIIPISATEIETEKLVLSMFTDPTRIKRSDVGHPENCSVFQYQLIFNQDHQQEIQEACKTAKIGCVDCKKECAAKINSALKNVRQNRQKLLEKPEKINEILIQGAKIARIQAQKTLLEVKQLIGL